MADDGQKRRFRRYVCPVAKIWIIWLLGGRGGVYWRVHIELRFCLERSVSQVIQHSSSSSTSVEGVGVGAAGAALLTRVFSMHNLALTLYDLYVSLFWDWRGVRELERVVGGNLPFSFDSTWKLVHIHYIQGLIICFSWLIYINEIYGGKFNSCKVFLNPFTS